MADIMFTQGFGIAQNKLSEVVKFNEGRKQGQYKYGYIVKLSDGYMVRLSQMKPTSKQVMNIKRIRGK